MAAMNRKQRRAAAKRRPKTAGGVVASLGAEDHYRDGLARHRAGALEDAIAAYARAVALDAGHASAWGNMGAAQAGLGMMAAARGSLERAVAADRQAPTAHSNLGHLIYRLDDPAGAIPHLTRAVELDPGFALAWSNLGDAHRSLNQWDVAVGCYEKALAAEPDMGAALSNLVYALRTLCRWDGLAELEARLLALSGDAMAAGEASPIDPFVAVFLPLEAAAFHRIQRSHAVERQRMVAARGLAGRFDHGPRGGGKIRIGYASAAFREHATGYLLRHMFGHHDREHFEIIGYSLRPGGEDSECRAHIAAGMDRMVDVAGLSDVEAADLIHRDRIDVLVDIDGYTSRHRAGIFALRPAPLQAGWLGFPGTLGADWLDYVIADRVVAPAGAEAHFSEALVRLPHCYQANGHRHMALASGPRRADVGLPDEGFVFCCFNVARKIDPETFGLWMTIMGRAPDSVLWLLPDSAAVLAALRAEAGNRGVDPDRLIAAPRSDPLSHVSRAALADLFLDTLTCNAHTTASDALWSGLPVLTCPGETFASRVAASIVTAAGLDELVRASPQDYVELAVALATEPMRLAAIRERLEAGRESCPLFDTAATVRALEAAFAEMVARRERGEAPAAIDVAG